MNFVLETSWQIREFPGIAVGGSGGEICLLSTKGSGLSVWFTHPPFLTLLKHLYVLHMIIMKMNAEITAERTVTMVTK